MKDNYPSAQTEDKPLGLRRSPKGTLNDNLPSESPLRGLGGYPPHWQVKKLGEVVENHDSKRVPLKMLDRDQRTGNYPYYGASGVIDYIDEYIFDGEYLLLSEDGANLLARSSPIAFIASGQFWVNNHAHILKAKTDYTSNAYLEFFFSSKDISAYVTGSAQPKLSQKRMNEIEIPIPPLEEQKQIVEKLDALFERIDKAIKLLDENIKAADELFASALNNVFSNAEKKGWQVKKLGEQVKSSQLGLIRGKQDQSCDFVYPYLKMENITLDGNLTFKSIVFVNATIDEHSKYSLNHGDFIYNTRNSYELVGKNTVFRGQSGKYLFNNNILRIRFNEELVPEFAKYYLQSRNGSKSLSSMKKGTTNVSAIYQKDFFSILIPLPPLEEQKQIVAYLDSLCERQKKLKDSYILKRDELKALKASLLDAAFKGQLI